MKINNESQGQFTAPDEIRLVRSLPGPIERVWNYLVDPEKRAKWFAGGPIEPRVGGKVLLFVQHRNLSPDEAPPAGYQSQNECGQTMEGRVTRYAPPRLLAFTFQHTGESEAIFELTPDGDRVQLVLTHRSRGQDLPLLTNFAAGWHSHVMILLSLLENTERPLFWANHTRLLAEYQRTRSAANAS
jgi:uncharacterized protein YndB with AHSA1/START domain